MSEDDSPLRAKLAILAEPLAPFAELAVAPPPPPPPPVRDQQGRFITGNSGGGRPKGARNHLTEVFMSAIVEDFSKNGADAIARVRASDPIAYLRIVGAMVPPDLVMRREKEPEVDYAELTFEQAAELADAERKRRMVKRAIDGF